MTHPFSKAAVEAAAKALLEAGLWRDAWDRANEVEKGDALFKAEAAISAAFEHARGEGRLTEGKLTFQIIKDAGE